MSGFLETIWSLRWLFPAVIFVWWSRRLFASHGVRADEANARWRNLYRLALNERDQAKRRVHIQDAERAILGELANHVFTANSTERKALQEARDSLYNLRQAHSNSKKN